MFTGIIEELGEVTRILKQGNIILFTIKVNKVLEETKVGDSIAVNGVCLTVVKKEIDALSFEVMPETLKDTNLGLLRVSSKVNLERALKLQDRLAGHFVSGHIDGLGVIVNKIHTKDSLSLTIRFPQALSKFIVLKGSISVEGVSLTVQDLKRDSFTVSLIPYTLKTTNLGLKNVGERVNLEVDLLGKYVREKKDTYC